MYIIFNPFTKLIRYGIRCMYRPLTRMMIIMLCYVTECNITSIGYPLFFIENLRTVSYHLQHHPLTLPSMSAVWYTNKLSRLAKSVMGRCRDIFVILKNIFTFKMKIPFWIFFINFIFIFYLSTCLLNWNMLYMDGYFTLLVSQPIRFQHSSIYQCDIV